MKQVEDGFYRYSILGKVYERLSCRISLGSVELWIKENGQLVTFAWRFSLDELTLHETQHIIGFAADSEMLVDAINLNAVADTIWAEWQVRIKQVREAKEQSYD